MTYRDDLEAAQARAEAAERRAQVLEREVAVMKGTVVEQPLPVPIPERFTVTKSADAVAISWRRMTGAPLVLLTLFVLVSDTLVVGAWAAGWDPLGLRHQDAPLVVVGVALVMTYSLAAGLLNRTRITASPAELHVRIGPVPWPGNRSLGRGELEQLFVRERSEKDSDGHPRTHWDLCALRTGGREDRLVRGLEEHAQAHFLELLLERHLGIVDRAVLGEASHKVRPQVQARG